MKDNNPQTTANTAAGKAKPIITNPLVELSKGQLNVSDIIAPSDLEIDFDYIKIGDT